VSGEPQAEAGLPRGLCTQGSRSDWDWCEPR